MKAYWTSAAQAVVARRVGGAERRAGAVRQLGHHVALGRGVALPVVERGDDVGEAREDPHVGLLAPEAWELVAQAAVGRKRIGVGLGRKRVETEHRVLPGGGRPRRRPLDARGRLVAFTMPRRRRRVIGRRRSNPVLFRQPARRRTSGSPWKYLPKKRAAARRCDDSTRAAPAFSLYGETPASHDDDFVHIEEIAARSQRYDWQIGRHVHHGLCQILVLAAGEVAYRLDEDAGTSAGPCALVVPPATVHAFRFTPAPSATC